MPAGCWPNIITWAMAALSASNYSTPSPTRPASAEQVDFPCVEPGALDAVPWRRHNRAAWGIENGLHQRLDLSHWDDRLPQSMRGMAMLRRFSNSLFRHGRSRQKRPPYKTTTDFFSAMNAEHHRQAIRCRQARPPSLQTAS